MSRERQRKSGLAPRRALIEWTRVWAPPLVVNPNCSWGGNKEERSGRALNASLPANLTKTPPGTIGLSFELLAAVRTANNGNDNRRARSAWNRSALTMFSTIRVSPRRQPSSDARTRTSSMVQPYRSGELPRQRFAICTASTAGSTTTLGAEGGTGGGSGELGGGGGCLWRICSTTSGSGEAMPGWVRRRVAFENCPCSTRRAAAWIREADDNGEGSDAGGAILGAGERSWEASWRLPLDPPPRTLRRYSSGIRKNSTRAEPSRR